MMKKFKDLQKKKGKKGFSMIELIIVIAIMAILIALIGTQLIPWLEKSRRSKDLTTLDTCLTNWKGALAAAENTSTGFEVTGIAGMEANTKAAYEELAGQAYDTDTELTNAFKCKDAKGGTVLFGVTSSGVCYVRIVASGSASGGLYVSAGYAGVYKANTTECPIGSASGGATPTATPAA